MVRRRKAPPAPRPPMNKQLVGIDSVEYKKLLEQRDDLIKQCEEKNFYCPANKPDFTLTTPNELREVTTTGAAYRVDIKAEHIESKALANGAYRETIRETTGLYFDVADVIAGVPEPYFQEIELPRETLTIFVDLACSHTVTKETANTRAAEIVNLFDTHRAKGDQIEIVFVQSALISDGIPRDGEIYLQYITGAPVSELSLLHYIACVPCFFRAATIPAFTLFSNIGLSASRPLTAEETRDYILPTLKGKGIYFSGLLGRRGEYGATYERIEFDNTNH